MASRTSASRGRCTAADGVPGVEPGSLLEVVVGVYGLEDAPPQWSRSFSTEAIKAGFTVSSYDPFLFYVHREGRYHGSLALAVDDICSGGDAVFHECITKLKRRFPFGKYRKGKGDFLGKRLDQFEDKTMRIDQKENVMEIEVINVSSARRSDPDDACTETEVSPDVAGSLNYVGRETRPDLCGPVSLLQGKFPKPSVNDMLEA